MSILDALKSYEETQDKYINLIASENVLIPSAHRPFISDIINRYVFEDSKDLYFPGRKILSDLENECCSMISHLLDARFVSVKPISGLNGMLCVLGLFLKKEDLLYSLSTDNGGHNVTQFMAKRLGLEHKFLPFNMKSMDIDYDALEKEVIENSIRMVYLDCMNILFGLDIKRLKSILDKRTFLVFDASHVMALIMGKSFSNPLMEGADILIGSTHKTFPGPHKAIFATNNHIIKKIFDEKNGVFISHHHTADVVSLAIVLEDLNNFMYDYAHETIKNSKFLAKRLHDCKLNVLFKHKDFTDTHQIWIGDNSRESVIKYADKLTKENIMVNAMNLPGLDGFGLRIGVQEITYRGLKEEEIFLLADVMLDIYNDNFTTETARKRDHIISKFCYSYSENNRQ